MSDSELARRCEESLVSVWPAVTTLIMQGWAVRFANGYSSRANSASAIATGARFTPELIAQVEQLYRAEGMKPRVRVTPVAHPDTKALLEARGYRPIDDSMTMVRSLVGSFEADDDVMIEPRPAPHWINGISIRQEGSKRSPRHLDEIVSRIRLPAAFASLSDDRGFGLCVVDGELAELGSIMVDAGHRGRGLGEMLVKNLLAFAAGQGARIAFLQVDCANAPAVRLYERLGFESLYHYNTYALA